MGYLAIGGFDLATCNRPMGLLILNIYFLYDSITHFIMQFV